MGKVSPHCQASGQIKITFSQGKKKFLLNRFPFKKLFCGGNHGILVLDTEVGERLGQGRLMAALPC